MKTNNKIFKVPLETILKDKWFMFMNTSAIFIGGDEIRRFKLHQKSIKRIVRGVVVSLVALVLLFVLFVLMADKTLANVSSHPIYKYAPVKIGGSERQQEIINWAWHISQDPDWIATLEAENGTWEENRIGFTGDVGLCQMRPSSWNWFIQSPEFQDYHYQILICAEEYNKATKRGSLHTTFYGWNNRDRAKRNFIWR